MIAAIKELAIAVSSYFKLAAIRLELEIEREKKYEKEKEKILEELHFAIDGGDTTRISALSARLQNTKQQYR